jgi:hypothetical protein
MELTLQELEDAINYWRAQLPATGDALVLSGQVSKLAELYGLMIYYRLQRVPLPFVSSDAQAVLEAWRTRTH